MNKLILILFTVLFLIGCNDTEESKKVKNIRIVGISEDACIKDKCIYSIKALKDVHELNFKANKEIAKDIKKGQILSLKYNKDLFIEEIIME